LQAERAGRTCRQNVQAERDRATRTWQDSQGRTAGTGLPGHDSEKNSQNRTGRTSLALIPVLKWITGVTFPYCNF
jgi:hypothetical protein